MQASKKVCDENETNKQTNKQINDTCIKMRMELIGHMWNSAKKLRSKIADTMKVYTICLVNK